MPLTYEECSQDVLDLADSIMRKHYKDLIDAGLTIRYLFAINEDAIGGALKHQGYAAAAIVKRNSYKDRVEGKTDCTITIDREWWTGHDDKQCAAVMDHELYHILIARDDDGAVITDDIGRPKVKLRLHDVQIGEFDDIVKRHGRDAVGAQQVAEASKRWVQNGLPFSGDDRGPEKESPQKKRSGDSFKDKMRDVLDEAGVDYKENVSV